MRSKFKTVQVTWRVMGNALTLYEFFSVILRIWVIEVSEQENVFCLFVLVLIQWNAKKPWLTCISIIGMQIKERRLFCVLLLKPNLFLSTIDFCKICLAATSQFTKIIVRRQRGRVVRAPDLRSNSRGFKSRSDHWSSVDPSSTPQLRL